MTQRGEWVVAVAIITAFWLVLLGAAWLGQEWEADRQQSEVTQHGVD